MLAGADGGRRDAILLNAAGAIAAAGHAEDLREGLELAREAVDSGAAAARLDELARFSQCGLGTRSPSPGLGAIAEFKRRSPSLGDIRPDADPGPLAADYARAGAAAVSVLVDERFGGDWDDLRAARASATLPLLAKGFFSTDEHLRTAKEAGADAVLLLLRDLDDAQTATLMALAAELGLDTLVEAHDAAELERAIALRRARDRRQRPRPRRPSRSTAARSSTLVARIPRRPDRDRRERHPHPRAGRRRRARRRGRHPRRLGADAGARPRREAARAARAPARQGLRPDPRGGRGRRGRGGRRPRRLHPRAGEPARRRPMCCPFPDELLAVAVWVGEAGASGAPLDQVHEREAGKVRGRDAVLLREGEQVARLLDLPWEEDDPGHWDRAAAEPGRVVLAGQARRRQRRRGDPARPSVGGRRELAARGGAGNQGSGEGARLRGGGAVVTETYGAYGGRYVPETLIPALDELTAAWEEALADESYARELDELARTYAGRPTPLTRAERFAPEKRLYLKREDLLHTGAHKLNNALGQAVLARRLGKQRIVAETGAGQHGVATATVCARFGLECVVYMGSEDMRRQSAERRADGPARRRGAAGRVRDEDAEGGDERGDPRLDHERRDDALPDRLVRRPCARTPRSCASCRP